MTQFLTLQKHGICLWKAGSMGDLTSELFVICKYVSMQVLADAHTSVGEIHHLSELEDRGGTHFNQIIWGEQP